MKPPNLKLIILLLVIATWSSISAQDDTSSVMIVVDVEGVTLQVNGVEVTEDSYGNLLRANATFILRLQPGEYNLVFSHPDYPQAVRNIVVTAGEVTSLDITFIEVVVPVGEAVLKISTVPDSAEVVINGETQSESLPLRLDVLSGEYTIEVIRAGYEPLTHEIMIQPAKTYSLEFLLKAFPPIVQTAESMGLEKVPIQAPLDVTAADRTLTKYVAMAETFSIIPFGQGVMAKIMIDEDDGGVADVLITSGALLTVGSFIYGIITSRKQRAYLESENERIDRDNALAKEMNHDVDLTVRQTNGEALKFWEVEILNAGRVEVTITDHSVD